MSRNLKLSYILFFAFSAILIAWKTLSNFFGGVAINFIALLGLVFVVVLTCLKDKDLWKRIKDLIFIAGAFCILELVIYFACEFGYGERLTGFSVYQNIISFLGILFLTYLVFRFTTEHLGKKIRFIEIMLGNEKRVVKEKKAKELTNGSLEDKPNNKTSENSTEEKTETAQEETEIIIETEE